MPPDNTEEEMAAQATPPQPITVPVMPALEKTGNAIFGEAKPKRKNNDLSDMFAVPQPEDNDMDTSDLFTVPEEDVDMDDNLDDLTRVTNEDVMGKPPRPRRVVQPKFRRTSREYIPPTSMGGMR